MNPPLPARGRDGWIREGESPDKGYGMSRIWVVVMLGFLGLVTVVSGQDGGNASPYFDCPYVNYFDPDCPQLKQGEIGAPVAGQRSPEDRQERIEPREDGEEREREEGEQEGMTPEEYILFPRESLAADTPPLLAVLFNQPTIENARRYVRWHARRVAQLQVVQALIQQAGKELERGPGVVVKAGE